MNPVSTAGLYASALLNINNSQSDIAKYTAQAGSGKVAQDLAGFGGQAGQLIAANTVSARLSSYVAGATALTDRLDVQNLALSQVATAAQGARTAVATAVGQGNATTLIASLQSQLTSASSALNTQYQGRYLFSGGSDTAPVATSDLSALTTPAAVTAAFTNGSSVQVNRLDDNTVVKTGVLASAVGTPIFNALQAISAYNASANGPLSGPLTTAQTSFLSGVLSQLDSALTATNTVVADNGVVQKQVSTAQANLTDQQTGIKTVLSNITDVNEADVATKLNLAQTALDASAKVFTNLQSDSLLTLLSSTG